MLINFAKSKRPDIHYNREQIDYAFINPGTVSITFMMGSHGITIPFENDEDCKSAWEQLKALMDYHEIS